MRTAVARAFLTRTQQLSQEAQGALIVAACSAGDPAVVTDACRSLGLDPAALAEAVDADLLTAAGAVEFRHPLVRAAVVRAAEPGRLRAVHAALATATPPTDPDRCAGYRAAAVIGPEAQVATDLDGVAHRARGRSASDVAATALERAGWLSAAATERVDRLVAAAECAWIAGQGERALTLTGHVGETVSTVQLARVAYLRGTITARTGSSAEAITVYTAAVRHVEQSHPDAAVELWADAANAAFFRADVGFLRGAVTALDRLRPRVTTSRSRLLGNLAAGMARTLTGQVGAELIRQSVAELATSDAMRGDPMRAEWLVLGPLYLREEGRSREVVGQTMREVRETAPGDIVIGRVWAGLALGELELGAGRAEQGLVQLDEVAAVLATAGLQDMDLDPGPDRVEALMRLGRADEARSVAVDYHRLSAAKGQACAMARAERALGLAAGDETGDAHFATAGRTVAGGAEAGAGRTVSPARGGRSTRPQRDGPLSPL